MQEERSPRPAGREARIGKAMLKPVLNASRYLVLAAVVGALLGAAALFIYGLVDVVVVIVRTIASGEVSTVGAKQLMLYFIEVFDLFLLGTVMLIMGLSLYELFMDSDLKLPARLEIRTFEDLKTNLVRGDRGHGGDVSRPDRFLERPDGRARPRRRGGARDRRAERLPVDREAGEEVTVRASCRSAPPSRST
jgi:uncharacterized membrane protein YqhA